MGHGLQVGVLVGVSVGVAVGVDVSVGVFVLVVVLVGEPVEWPLVSYARTRFLSGMTSCSGLGIISCGGRGMMGGVAEEVDVGVGGGRKPSSTSIATTTSG